MLRTNYHHSWWEPRSDVEVMTRGHELVESSWNVMAHGDAQEGKWMGKLANGMGSQHRSSVASTLHTTSEHGVSSITTADAHTSAASSLLNWHPCRFKWTRPFCRKTKSGFCVCAITFHTQSSITVAECCRCGCNEYTLCTQGDSSGGWISH